MRRGRDDHRNERGSFPVRDVASEYSKFAKPTLSTTRPIPRRGFTRVEAAMYLGISPSKFDELRKAKRIGAPKIIGSRLLFDVYVLDEFFDALPDENHDADDGWTASV
jgi:hypothetical protein